MEGKMINKLKKFFLIFLSILILSILILSILVVKVTPILLAFIYSEGISLCELGKSSLLM